MTNIYDQSYNSSNEQKEAISYYISQVPMTNSDCEKAMLGFAQYLVNRWGSKQGVIGFIFSKGHPELIMSFIRHLCWHMWNGSMPEEGNYQLFHDENPEHMNGAKRYQSFDESKVYQGIWLNCNAKSYHICRHTIGLIELLEAYKWRIGNGNHISWVSQRERRDGKHALSSIMDTSFWRNRVNPGLPNEFAREIYNSI
jgi:hypothetical protein